MNARLWLLPALLAPLLAGCESEPDALRLENMIRHMARAVEDKEHAAFMAQIAEDFTGQRGTVDRAEVERLLRMHSLRNRSIGVALSGLEVEVREDRATTRFEALLTGSDHWIPERGQRYSFTVGWRREGTEWRIVNARWE